MALTTKTLLPLSLFSALGHRYQYPSHYIKVVSDVTRGKGSATHLYA